MNTSKFSLRRFTPFALALCLASSASASPNNNAPRTLAVNGTMVETGINLHVAPPYGIKVVLSDTISGDLSGTGLIHIYSGDVEGPNVLNILGTRIWHLADGQLFTSEVGESLNGDTTVHATVTGGTGIYKGAIGNLTLIGVHVPSGVELTYSGTLVLRK